MSRYDLPVGDAALYESGSDGKVLRNLLGITDKQVMNQTEFEAFVGVQGRYALEVAADTRFDAALIRRMHEDWLGEIYDWAGSYRKVNVSKGAFQWPPVAWLADLMAMQAGPPPPDYGFSEENTAEHDVYISAMTKAYAMDYAELCAFFERALARALASAS